MNKFKNSMIGSVLILAMICLVATAGLAYTNFLTADIIKAQASAASAAAFEELLPGVEGYEPLKIDLPEGVTSAFKAGENNYAFTAVTKGYNGDVTFIIVTDLDGNYVGIRMPDGHGESKGFGTKVQDPAYLETYYGFNSPDAVDGVSGVTYTSKALKSALQGVNEAYKQIG